MHDGFIVVLKVIFLSYFSSVLVKEHLDVFLRGAQSLNPEPQHIKEVCFLCVQCMEVRILVGSVKT